MLKIVQKCFLNCTNGTKSREASQIFGQYNHKWLELCKLLFLFGDDGMFVHYPNQSKNLHNIKMAHEWKILIYSLLAMGTFPYVF